MSSRFSTSRVSLSSDSSAVASSSSRSKSLNATSSLRRLVTAAFADANGGRRSWLTADSKALRSRSASLTWLMAAARAARIPGAGGAGGGGDPLLAQGNRGLSGEGFHHPPVRGGENASTEDQRDIVVDWDVHLSFTGGNTWRAAA